MAKQVINLGTMADNKSGDPLRTAFTKVNENFTELYNRPTGGGTGWALVKDGATVAAIEEAINIYGNELEVLQDAFAAGVDDPNYPWGANPDQLGFLTYDQMMNFNIEGSPSMVQAFAITKAHNAANAYAAYRDLIVSATVSSGEKEWSFDNEGVLTLPANGTIKDSDGNIVIANLDKLVISGGIIGTTNDAGGWGGYDIYLAPNGEGYAWIGVPRDISAANGASLVLGNTHPNGSGVQIITNGSTWQFENGGVLHLPVNGDIVDSDGVSVITGTPPITELPEWLSVVTTNHLPTRNTDYGWDSNGVWTTNATIGDGQEGVSYPIRYNGSVPANQGVVVSVDFVVNDLGADFGIGIWETGTDPIWAWGDLIGGNRIGAQYNGPQPELYGIVGQGTGSQFRLTSGQTYTARLTVTPPSEGFITVTLETLQSGTVLDTISYQEQAFTNPYRIGFASDQDDGANRTYMKNLTININNSQQPLTDTLISYNSGAPVEPVTGGFVFAGRTTTVHNNDMTIQTTRDSWDTDADISITSADDVWITAEGDMVRISAATDVEITANESSMSTNTWLENADFDGVWNGTTLLLIVPSDNTNVTAELDVYLNGTYDIWFKTAGGVYQTVTTQNATKEIVDTNTQYTLTLDITSPSANINVQVLKLIAGASYNGPKNWRFNKEGTTELPNGLLLGYEAEQTITTGFTIQIADLSGATASWGSPVINADNIQTSGWDYVSFSNQAWYEYLFTLLGGNSNGVNVTWAAGSEQVQSAIFVQFTNPETFTFQFTPSPDAGGSPYPGTWYFPVQIGSSTVIPAAHTKTINSKEWRYTDNGSTQFPGALIKSVSNLAPYNGDRIQLDLTKSIQKLGEGEYGLADGVEGQVIHLVMVDNAAWNNIAVIVANARGYNNRGTNWIMLPFRRWDNNIGEFTFTDGICTLIFTDGAWQATGAVWD